MNARLRTGKWLPGAFAGSILRRFVDALRDLAPIIVVIAFFQVLVIQRPFPDLANIAVGIACVIAGLALFVQGLESGLFPLGESIAHASPTEEA